MAEMAEVEEMESRPGDAGSNPTLGPHIDGAVYEDGVLQPGCMVCSKTIPPRQARFRAKVCSNACRNALRKIRSSPAAIAAARLNCQVCREAIPTATAKKLGVVCGVPCRNEMRRYRFQILKTQKCPHCYHPSTPAEWEEYRQWRAARGPMQAFMRLPGRGNLAWKREKTLRDALKAAVGALKAELAVILRSYASERMEGLPVRSSLSQDGEALAIPLEKIIAMAEPLLASPKKGNYILNSLGEK